MFAVVAIKEEPTLDTVERTVLQLLKEGYTVSEISRLIGLPTAPIISELAYKGVLNPDATFRNIELPVRYELKGAE